MPGFHGTFKKAAGAGGKIGAALTGGAGKAIGKVGGVVSKAGGELAGRAGRTARPVAKKASFGRSMSKR